MTLDRAGLETHLRNVPPLVDDPAYLVLADWLQTQGQFWGELIVLQHRAQNEPELARDIDALLEKHRETLFGGLQLSRLEWHLGFLRRATLAVPFDMLAVLTELVERPIARMLETLSIDPSPTSFPVWRSWESSPGQVIDPWRLSALAGVLPKHISRLGFGPWPARAATAYVQTPRFDELSHRFGYLRGLSVTGSPSGEDEGVLEMPELVELSAHYADCSEDAVIAIAESRLPKLERLGVWLGGETSVIVDSVHPADDYAAADPDASRYPDRFSADDLAAMDVDGVECGVENEAILALLQHSRWPALAHLAFGAAELPPDMLQEVLHSPLVATLRTLDLSASGVVDNHLQVLRAAAPVLSRLEAIDLTGNDLTDGVARELAELLPNAKIDSGSEPEPFMFRYVATVE